jgi:hypothetical protein
MNAARLARAASVPSAPGADAALSAGANVAFSSVAASGSEASFET